MSGYNSVTHVNGETFNAGSANAWEQRIETYGDTLEASIAGGTASTGALTVRVAALESAFPTIPFSPNSPSTASPATAPYTIGTADWGNALLVSGGGTITLGTATLSPVPAASVLEIHNMSNATITVVAGSGVTLRVRGN